MRVITAEAQAALDTGRFAVRALVKMVPGAPDSPLCLWDDLGSIVVGGDTYLGAPGRFTIEPSASTKDLSARNLNVVFSALDPLVVPMVEGSNWHQRPILVQRVIIAIDTPQILNVFPEFAGFMDQIFWSEAVDGQATLKVQCESASREYSRTGSRTSSDADQRERDANDGFFRYSVSAVSQSIDWGRSPDAAPKQKKSGFAGLLDKIF